MKNFEEFKAAFKNGEFKAELEELAKTAKDKAANERDTLFSEFAKKMGYDVSVEDIAAHRAAAQEMKDEDVEAVAGGFCIASDWCGEVADVIGEGICEFFLFV